MLPLNWWERDISFYIEVFENFNVGAAIDLFGSTNMGIACVMSDPPRPYLALLRNQTHVDVVTNAVDEYIMREMGREGPPPSKFFENEAKEIVKRLFPEVSEDDEDDDSAGEEEDSDDEDL